MKLIEAIGIRIDKLIEERENFTQYQLGKLGGIPRATIWKIINPDTTRVKTVKIDTIYQISATYLWYQAPISASLPLFALRKRMSRYPVNISTCTYCLSRS